MALEFAPQFNPFCDVAVGDPWRSAEPDVKSINRQAFDSLLRLVTSLKKTPNVGALVLGEAGIGKTHLIKRLVTSKEADLIFVYVHPMKDHRTMMSSLLQTVLTNLISSIPSPSGSGSGTQMDLLVAHVVAAAFEEYIGENPQDGGAPFLKTIQKAPLNILHFKSSPKWQDVLKNTVAFLARRVSLIGPQSKNTLRVLFQYLDKSKKDSVITYLSGFMPDDEEAETLGLTVKEADLTIQGQEQRALEILRTIGKLLHYYRPMVICFDQLENLKTRELVGSFGTLINELVNEIDNVLPIAFVRPESWENTFQRELDDSARGRLAANLFVLTGCDLDQAMDIVKMRLEWAYEGLKKSRVHDLYPFDKKKLQQKLMGVTSPREVLTAANRVYMEMVEDGSKLEVEVPIDVIQSNFAAEVEKLLAASTHQPFKSDAVGTSLKLYFEYKVFHTPPSIEVRNEEPTRLLFEVQCGETKEHPRVVDVWIESAVHWKPLHKTLSLLTKRMEKGEARRSFVLRDVKQKIPPKKGRMPKTVEKLKDYEGAGGKIAYLEYDHLVALYSLVYTADKVGSGDLVYTADQMGRQETVRESHLGSFIKERFQSAFVDRLRDGLCNESKTNGPDDKKPDPREVIKQVEKLLKKPPFMFPIDKIVAFVSKKHNDIAPTFVVKAIGRYGKNIRQIPVTPPLYCLK